MCRIKIWAENTHAMLDSDCLCRHREGGGGGKGAQENLNFICHKFVSNLKYLKQTTN